MSQNQAQMTAKLAIAGDFEFRDKDGNLLKTIRLSGSIPLAGEEQIEQAKELIQQGAEHGNRSE